MWWWGAALVLVGLALSWKPLLRVAILMQAPDGGEQRQTASIEPADRYLREAAYRAARDGDVGALKMLRLAGLLINDSPVGSALHGASAKGRERAVEYLLAAGIDVNLVELQTHPHSGAVAGTTALATAAGAGHAGVVRQLLAAGARADAASPDGVSPLLLAALIGREDIIAALLAAGAPPNGTKPQPALFALLQARDNPLHGLRPLSQDLLAGDWQAWFTRLKSQGFDLAVLDADGRTALHLAAAMPYPELVLALVGAGLNVNAQDRFGATPLAYATHRVATRPNRALENTPRRGPEVVVRTLLAQGALPDPAPREAAPVGVMRPGLPVLPFGPLPAGWSPRSLIDQDPALRPTP